MQYMTNYSIPSAFFKGLKEEQQSLRALPNINNITMLQCLRWVLKTHGMNIEIKRSDRLASTSMNMQLIKYNKDGSPIHTEFDISATDHKIEKGLWELENKIMQYAKLVPMNGFENILGLLRKGELGLPPHNDIRNEIIMKGYIARIGHIGTDQIGEDLFGGVLILNNEIVLKTDPQKRMGHVLDNLENALFAKRREAYRKKIGEYMLKLSAAAGSAGY